MNDYRPSNPLVSSLLMDKYQITAGYADFVCGVHEDQGTDDYFFRRCPFGGEFAIYAGLDEFLRYLSVFSFSDDDIAHIRSFLPATCDPRYLEWLREVNASCLTIHAIPEATVVFPRLPLIRSQGPSTVRQMIESALLNLNNFATLCTTNGVRLRMAGSATRPVKYLGFGLRRAQGPDGAISASKYLYMAGFDGDSNLKACKMFGIPSKGTMMHSFIQKWAKRGLDRISKVPMPTRWNDALGKHESFLEVVLQIREALGFTNTHEGELAAFIGYAIAWPDEFLALVDTYNTLQSGVPNYICVAAALRLFGHQPLGIRLDSGDLAYLSKSSRAMFREADGNLPRIMAEFRIIIPKLETSVIVASNDLNEKVILSLETQGHEIDVWAIGTHAVTCETQPALGGVYKIVESKDDPVIKLSNDPIKVTLPGAKKAYRFFGQDGKAICDYLILDGEEPPSADHPTLIRHPFDEHQRARVRPSRIEALHQCVWKGSLQITPPSLDQLRDRVQEQLSTIRSDHLRLVNPTPYKVSVSEALYHTLHELWDSNQPIPEIF